MYDEGSGTVLLEDRDQVLAYGLDAKSTQATWVWWRIASAFNTETCACVSLCQL